VRHAVAADMERDDEASSGTRGLALLTPYKRASNSWRMDIKGFCRKLPKTGKLKLASH
jgi:hypothetical protein